jgi:hypothetical protein
MLVCNYTISKHAVTQISKQKLSNSFDHNTVTINVPLILKMRDIIFFLRANYFVDHFKGYFEGAKTFLTPKLSRAQRGTI